MSDFGWISDAPGIVKQEQNHPTSEIRHPKSLLQRLRIDLASRYRFDPRSWKQPELTVGDHRFTRRDTLLYDHLGADDRPDRHATRLHGLVRLDYVDELASL